MHIQGLQKNSFVDYPGYIGCTLFLHGCNLRCPFCHNASLVVEEKGNGISESEVFNFLQSRENLLEAVCISGGEPLMQEDIIGFLQQLRAFNFKIKLDTNGFFPNVLKRILELSLVDYVAMDVKSSKENYTAAIGREDISIAPLCESVDVLMNSSVDYEFRTTAVKGLHNVEDFRRIGKWLSGAKNYYIQSFKDSGSVIGKNCMPFTADETKILLSAVRESIPHAQVREF